MFRSVPPGTGGTGTAKYVFTRKGTEQERQFKKLSGTERVPFLLHPWFGHIFKNTVFFCQNFLS